MTPLPMSGVSAEDIIAALDRALSFVLDEVENRESAGGEMTDYLGEAIQARDDLLSVQAALSALHPVSEAA